MFHHSVLRAEKAESYFVRGWLLEANLIQSKEVRCKAEYKRAPFIL